MLETKLLSLSKRQDYKRKMNMTNIPATNCYVTNYSQIQGLNTIISFCSPLRGSGIQGRPSRMVLPEVSHTIVFRCLCAQLSEPQLGWTSTMAHSQVWQGILAVSWECTWGSTDYLHLASPCGLGFSQHGGWVPTGRVCRAGIQRELGRGFNPFSDKDLEIT